MVKAVDMIGSNSQLQNHWIRRVIAAIIDAVIIFIIAAIITSLGFILGSVIPLLGWLALIIVSLLWFLYCAFLEGTTGATLGKRFLNLKVVSTEGSIDLTKAIIRNVSKIVPYGLGLVIDFIVGFITDGDPRQRFLDRVSNTTVVRTDVQEIFAGAYQPPGGPIPAPVVPQGSQPQYSQPRPSYSQPSQPHEAELRTSARPAYETPRSGTPTPSYESTVTPAAEGKGDVQYSRSELVNMRKDELIKIARQRDLKTSGTKRDLIDRILGEET